MDADDGKKKRRGSLRWAIILFAIWAAVFLMTKWFRQETYDLLVTLIFPIPLIGPTLALIGMQIWTGVFAIWGIIIFAQKPSFKAAVPIITLLAVLPLAYLSPLPWARVKLEHALYAEKRMEIVAAIQKGELIADKWGEVQLPKGCQAVSSQDEVCVFVNSRGRTVVGFWAFRALFMNPYEAVVYTSEDVPPSSNMLDDASKIYEIRKLDPNWYYIVALS